MNTNLSLLPHDSLIIIKDIIHKKNYIHLMKNLLNEFLDALEYFENSSLNHFDAQVGETLCQIRAYKIYTLKVDRSVVFNEQLKELKIGLIKVNKQLDLKKQEYEAYLKVHKSQRPQHLCTPITLVNFFLDIECLITIPEDAVYIFISYFLCHYNLVDLTHIPISIDYNRIAKNLLLSKSYSKKLGHYYQKLLSELSCNFIYQLLNEIPGEINLKLILPQLHLSSDEGRMVMPCYSVTKIILLHMIKKSANVVLLMNINSGENTRKVAFYLKGANDINDFARQQLNEKNSDEPGIVLYGECFNDNGFCMDKIQSDLFSRGLKQIVLSNNAAHPQYCGETLKQFSDNPFQALLTDALQQQRSLADTQSLSDLSSELDQMKKLARSIGCTIDNQKLFLLKHIFCDRLSNYSEYYMPCTYSVLNEQIKESFTS